jgi:hypothetical protein
MMKSQFLRHGSKFIVTDQSEDSTYGPGTTGFVSYVKGFDQDFPNVAYLVVSIVRRGKGGKLRVERSEISTPIFEFDNAALKEHMPDEKRRFYVHIEQQPNPSHVNEMLPVDFIGWAFAVSMFVNKLSQCSKHFKPWPNSSTHVLNRALNAAEIWSESEGQAVEILGNIEYRETFTRAARMMESTLVKSSLGYMSKITALEVAALEHILKINPKDNASKIAENRVLATAMKDANLRAAHLAASATRLVPAKKAK